MLCLLNLCVCFLWQCVEIKISNILLKSVIKNILDKIVPCSYFEVLSVYFQLVFEQLSFKKAKLCTSAGMLLQL